VAVTLYVDGVRMERLTEPKTCDALTDLARREHCATPAVYATPNQRMPQKYACYEHVLLIARSWRWAEESRVCREDEPEPFWSGESVYTGLLHRHDPVAAMRNNGEIDR
jgi:hypothetical protein